MVATTPRSYSANDHLVQRMFDLTNQNHGILFLEHSANRNNLLIQLTQN